MSRIVKKFDERRIEFLQATQELFFSTGYEKMSIVMLTKKVGVAKGTFYHYFNSKEELLTQWVIHEVTQKTVPLCKKIANKPNLDALTKLNKIFQQGREWKLQNIDMIISLMKILYDNNNIRLRIEMAKQSALLMDGILKKVIEQGIREKIFTISYPKEIPQKLTRIVHLFSEDLAFMILKHYKNKNVLINDASKLVHIWHDIIEKILGAPSKSITLVNNTFIEAMLNHISIQKS